MNLRVTHQLRYEYASSVVLDPHTLYLFPKIYPHQRLVEYNLRIDPTPTSIVRNLDAEGNVQQLIYFREPSTFLQVDVDMVVESNPFNSFDFVLFPFETERLPFNYPESDRFLLTPYLERSEVTTLVEQYARQIASEAKWQTVSFLTLLCSAIRNSFVYEVRPVGPALPPEQTLITRKGSCRDYATFYVAACRSLGLAARFVSGYLYGSAQQEHELHAWAEVYLPGAGWRGFDPTEGSVVINKHLFLASSAYNGQLAPLAGTFRGKTRSSMTTALTITGTEPES